VGSTSSAQSVTLTNTGTASLSISGIALGGTNVADFNETTNCGTSVAAGANCTISVTFTPAAAGPFSASVSITDNASGSPQSITLSGTGTAPAPAVGLSASALTFASQSVGTTSPAQTVTLTNTGTAALTISSIAVTGTNATDFSETTTCGASVAVNANCNINVTFTPAAAGTFAAAVTVTDNAGNSPQSIMLSGTGFVPAPAVSLSVNTLTFPSQTVGTTSSAQSVTLTNSGTAALTISSITVTGTGASDFAQTNTCPASVVVEGSCSISVTFTPSGTGSFVGAVTITDNAANSPQSIALSGIGGSGTVNNQAQIIVDQGPDPELFTVANVPFVTINVCAPGSATNCQSIDHVLVDTGSSGLRLLQEVLNPTLLDALPAQMSGSNTVGNCVTYGDGSYTWGPVLYADVYVAGETTAGNPNFTGGLPVQVIAETGAYPTPGSTCNDPTEAANTAEALGANALMGVGLFQQDCGPDCVPNPPLAAVYYSCSTTACSVTDEPLLDQVQNPVSAFVGSDNNGLVITLQAIPQNPDVGAATDTGTITFGIGTQGNNSLGTATVYTTDDVGEFVSTYAGVQYGQSVNPSTHAFIDSGSNGLFFLSPSITAMPDCGGNFTGFYCPANATSFTITNTGLNGNSGQVTIKFDNAENLVNNNPTFAAFDDLGGDIANTVDYGLPFFFGRTIFVGIENQPVTTPSGVVDGPLWAY